MTTPPPASQIDMAEIENNIKAALALPDNKDACRALEPIAVTLIKGNQRNMNSQYMAPALAVIEQIAARGRGDPATVASLYASARNANFPHSVLHPSVLRSLGHLCAGSPSAWNLSETFITITSTFDALSKAGAPIDQGTKFEQQTELCRLAVGIATAAAKANNPDLSFLAELYLCAKGIPYADGLIAETAKKARSTAETALSSQNVDTMGISRLFHASISLAQKSLRRQNENGLTSDFVSETANTYFDMLEQRRQEFTQEVATLDSEDLRQHLCYELAGTYSWFSRLRDLPPQHAAQLDHAMQMARWFDDNANGEAPATAWSVAQAIAPPPVTSVFARLSQLGQSGGGAANTNAPQAKRSSSYACS